MNRNRHLFIFTSLAFVVVILSVWINHFVFADSTDVGTMKYATEVVTQVIFLGDIHIQANGSAPKTDTCRKIDNICPKGLPPQLSCGMIGIDADSADCNLTEVLQYHQPCIDKSNVIRLKAVGLGDKAGTGCTGYRGLQYRCMVTCSSSLLNPITSCETNEGWNETSCA